MPRLPNIQVTEPPSWQRERLARWLREWQADRLLREGDGELRLPLAGGAAVKTGRRTRPGEIGLLHPSLVPGADGPVYVAVLTAEGRMCLMAPYGRFSEPATPGEWLTGRADPALRVLCLWNTRTVPYSWLAGSWAVDKLEVAERWDAAEVLRSLNRRETLSERLRERVGPPLHHPLDPRWDYLAEERERLGDWPAADLDVYGKVCGGSDELRLAAEPGAPYGRVLRYSVAGTAVSLRLVLRASRDVYGVEVLGAAGDVVRELDGARLRSAAGMLSEPVADGRATVGVRLVAGEMHLVMPDGRVVALLSRDA